MIANYFLPTYGEIIVDLDLSRDQLLHFNNEYFRKSEVHRGHLLRYTDNQYAIYAVSVNGRYELRLIRYSIGLTSGKKWIDRRIKSAKFYPKVEMTL